MSNLKKIVIPANGPGPHKEMANRIKSEFKRWRQESRDDSGGRLIEVLEKNILAIIKEYDLADAMRHYEGKNK